MKVWLLEANYCDYDEYDSMVVLAETEKRARELGQDLIKSSRQNIRDWSCREIDPATESEGIICDSFNAG